MCNIIIKHDLFGQEEGGSVYEVVLEYYFEHKPANSH